MAAASTLTIALGGFGLGLGAALVLLLVAGRQAFEFLTTFNAWALRGIAAALTVLSIAAILMAGNSPSESGAPAASAAAPSMTGNAAADAGGGSMEAATAALAARLAATGGTDQDWSLLAQSYDFLGRADDAKLAREHKVSPQRSLQDAMAATAPVRPSAMMPAPVPQASAPASKVAALFAQADEHRRKREYRQACDVYRQVIAKGGMTADAWADYADALASAASNGSLAGEPARAIDQALAMDPKHTKALWLKASLAQEERRYQDAVATWRQLLALMPPGSSDARIIEANLAEAQRLAGKTG